MAEDRSAEILARAAELGFHLTRYRTDNGHLVWEWRHGLEPRPQFVARRVAIHWMHEWLEHDRTEFTPAFE
jgi:hypothetical protein